MFLFGTAVLSYHPCFHFVLSSTLHNSAYLAIFSHSRAQVNKFDSICHYNISNIKNMVCWCYIPYHRSNQDPIMLFVWHSPFSIIHKTNLFLKFSVDFDVVLVRCTWFTVSQKTMLGFICIKSTIWGLCCQINEFARNISTCVRI